MTTRIDAQILALLSNEPVFLKDIFLRLNGIDRNEALSALARLNQQHRIEELQIMDDKNMDFAFGTGYRLVHPELEHSHMRSSPVK